MLHTPCCRAPLSSVRFPECSSQLSTLQGASVRDVQAVSLLLCAHGQRPAHGLCRCVFCPYNLPWRQAAARLHSLGAGSCLQELCLQPEMNMCTVASASPERHSYYYHTLLPSRGGN